MFRESTVKKGLNHTVAVKTLLALAMLVSFVAISGSALATTVRLDGVKDGNDNYTGSVTVGWINGHKTNFSRYDDYSNQTEVFYGGDDSTFYLYMAVPLYAKTMIWGTGFTNDDRTEYEGQWLTHHSGTLDMDYDKATGSEKVLFGAITNIRDHDDHQHVDREYEYDLQDDVEGSVKTSLDYLIDNVTSCDDTNCDARLTAMSFELQFNIGLVAQASLLQSIQDNGLEFHMSPERWSDISVVPLPAALPLYGTGLAVMGFLGWRRRRRAAA